MRNLKLGPVFLVAVIAAGCSENYEHKPHTEGLRVEVMESDQCRVQATRTEGKDTFHYTRSAKFNPAGNNRGAEIVMEESMAPSVKGPGGKFFQGWMGGRDHIDRAVAQIVLQTYCLTDMSFDPEQVVPQ